MPDIVTFDPVNLIIEEISVGGDNELDVSEIYSEWKVWQALSDNAKYPPAFRYVGSDPISDVQNLGATYFIRNGWRIKPAELDHDLVLDGNIYLDGGGTKVTVRTNGAFATQVSTRVSNLVDSAVARLDLAQLQEAIYCDVSLGDDNNEGTPTSPVQTLAQAFTLALANNLLSISINGSVVMDRAVSGWKFSGTVSKTNSQIDFNGYTLSNCRFNDMTLTGNANNSNIFTQNCLLTSLSGATGIFVETSLLGTITLGSLAKSTFHQCFSDVPGMSLPILDMTSGGGHDLQVRNYSGGLQISNLDQPSQDVSVDFNSGHLHLDATCTNGNVILRGVGKLTDNSGVGLTLDKRGFIGLPDDAPTDWTWLYELTRRVFLSQFNAP